MELLYLTDKIVYNLKDKLIYKEISNKNNEYVLITSKNWKDIYSEYGWENIDLCWETLLNDKYVILECGAGGDCLFHCIVEAFNLNTLFKKKSLDNFLDIKNLRKQTSNMITKNNFDLIIDNYRAEVLVGEFQGKWNPNTINNINDFKKEVAICGDNFWGDHIIIQLLCDALKINILILDSYNTLVTKTINTKYKKYIILYYLNECHYQLVGKFNGKYIKTIFEKLPKKFESYL